MVLPPGGGGRVGVARDISNYTQKEMVKFNEIELLYKNYKSEIQKKLEEFKNNLKKDELDIFAELCFCLLTPQSKAEKCWDAIVRLRNNGILINGSSREIEKELSGIRFKRKKAKYIIEARKKFFKKNLSFKSLISRFNDDFEFREFLVKEFKGIGWKEASHFCRNIGRGENFAILDRHIIKNLKKIGIIKEKRINLTSKKKYLEIEKKYIKFAKKIKIYPVELDLVLWAKETGYIFK